MYDVRHSHGTWLIDVRYFVALLDVVLAGCEGEGPLSLPIGPYQVTFLRTLPQGTETAFVDLNENGHALWLESGQPILWDNGAALQVPVGKFLGSSGQVVGESSVWIEGQLTELPGQTRGILEDGTVYFSRNDTMFTWRDGVVEVTDVPVVGLVGPEGRVWYVTGEGTPAREPEVCYFYFNGEYVPVAEGARCHIEMVEEGGWAIIQLLFEFVVPDMYQIREDDGSFLDLAHVNSEGESVAHIGILGKPDGTRVDLRKHFPGIRLGAINDDGEILAQLGNRVVLLKPR